MSKAHLRDLKPDALNARKHSVRNVGMIERSIQSEGFGRAILLANDGTVIAGNATIEAAASAGIENVRVIESDGTEVIAVKRTDVAPESERFYKLAIADNRAAELASWDIPNLQQVFDAGVDGAEFWFPEELSALLADRPSDDEWGAALGVLPDGDKAPFQQMTFTLHDTQAEQVNAAIDAARKMGPFVDSPNENSNGNALARICETFLTVVGRG